MISKVKVSVCMITFNHELYIKQAIESVFKQEGNFEIELVIGDDASTDRTVEIIKSIKPPSHVTLVPILRKVNLGMMQNFVQTLSQCEGKYIAMLDGDDYWIDPNKIQQQVDFLENNAHFAICFHPVKIDSGSGKIVLDTVLKSQEISTIYDLARGNFMHTCSVVFRAGLFESFPDVFYKSTVGDYFLHMLNAQHGKIKRLPEAMGVYRVHSGGVWSMQPNMDFKILTYLELMVNCFEPDVASILKKRHQSIAVKSLFKRLNEPGFEDRLKRCMLFGTDELQSSLIQSGIGKTKGNLSYYVGRVKSYL